jgi:transcriptional regulator with PAS, ATPase and Fis domain
MGIVWKLSHYAITHCSQRIHGESLLSIAKTCLIESTSGPQLGGPRQMRATPQRVENIREVASTLLKEANLLEYENAMTEVSSSVGLDVKSGLDFFDEVKRFEIRLISRALELTGGNQLRAARILGLGATTLNYKIKSYKML